MVTPERHRIDGDRGGHEEGVDRRLVGYAGILFFVWLVVAAVVFGGMLRMPTFADSAAYHRQYYSDHAAAVLLHAWFSCLFWGFFFLVFAAGVRRQLTVSGRESSGIWPRVTMAGATLAVAFGGTGLVFESVATGLAKEASDQLLRVLARMVALSDTVLLYWGLAVFVLSASLAILRSRRLSSSLAWLGIVSAVLMVVGALWPLSGDDRGMIAVVGLIGLSALGAWVLATAITLLRGRHRAEGAVRSP